MSILKYIHFFIYLFFQDAAVSSISEAALRSEYEKLGISNRGSTKGRESTNSITANPMVSLNKRSSNVVGSEEEKVASSPLATVGDNAMPSPSSKG